MSEAKELLRSRLRAQRLSMTKSEVSAKSKLIAKKLMAETDWDRIKNVHIYSSVSGWNEVDTREIIESIKNARSTIEIDVAALSKTQSIPKKKYDLIVVPALGFDKLNHRLGLGGGFYDRFLATQLQALKVGVCFQSGFVKKDLPHESHDIPLDKIVTEV